MSSREGRGGHQHHPEEPEPEPYVYVIPPERLCRKCGEREYHYRSAQLKLCRECHDQLKQERIEEKERKKAERLARKDKAGLPNSDQLNAGDNGGEGS